MLCAFIAGYQLNGMVGVVIVFNFDDVVQTYLEEFFWAFAVLSSFLALEAMLVSLYASSSSLLLASCSYVSCYLL